MYEVNFKYCDSLSGWEWREQSGVFSARNEGEAIQRCKQIYGLGIDCDYRIISVKKV